jgi:hypothetical protein
MNEWLSAGADALAAATGAERGALELSEQDEKTVLDLARIAAHDTGDRTNAPILCFLVGLAVGRSGATLDDAARAVPSSGD